MFIYIFGNLKFVLQITIEIFLCIGEYMLYYLFISYIIIYLLTQK